MNVVWVSTQHHAKLRISGKGRTVVRGHNTHCGFVRPPTVELFLPSMSLTRPIQPGLHSFASGSSKSVIMCVKVGSLRRRLRRKASYFLNRIFVVLL